MHADWWAIAIQAHQSKRSKFVQSKCIHCPDKPSNNEAVPCPNMICTDYQQITSGDFLTFYLCTRLAHCLLHDSSGSGFSDIYQVAESSYGLALEISPLMRMQLKGSFPTRDPICANYVTYRDCIHFSRRNGFILFKVEVDHE